jgi:subtilisin family serine protease
VKKLLFLFLVLFFGCTTFALRAQEAKEVEVPESDITSLQVTPVSALASALADTSTMTYYGNVVRSIYVNQPAAGIIRVSDAQAQYGIGSSSTIVAVIDTGIDPTHPALAGSIVPGYDFIRQTAGVPNEWLDLTPDQLNALAASAITPTQQKTVAATVSTSAVPILDQSTVVILDGGGNGLPSEFGHGTMVAGLIHLVAPGVKILPLKAFGADGTATLANVVSAIKVAADHGANVINMSFSVDTNNPYLKKVIAYAVSKGAVMVAASGNNGNHSPVYPAAYSRVIGVGSVDDYDVRSVFSNYGSQSARTSAPGEALITTYPGNNYAGVWGTSFSAALVSGAAALALQVAPAPSSAASAIPNAGKEINQGMGETRLQIMDVLNYLVNGGHDN